MKSNTMTVGGQTYTVERVAELGTIEPQLAQLMKARGFNAYGYVNIPGWPGDAVVYRAERNGAWQIVPRVRA